jgi:hypothetical protein
MFKITSYSKVGLQQLFNKNCFFDEMEIWLDFSLLSSLSLSLLLSFCYEVCYVTTA